MLIEALIGILLFSTGILAMIAMQGLAISYSADAKYRSDAAFFANELLGQIWVDRANIGTYAYPGGTAPARNQSARRPNPCSLRDSSATACFACRTGAW